jgi:hypothetical protein
MDAAFGVLILVFAGVGVIVILRGLRRRRGMLDGLRRHASEHLVRRARDRVGQDARPLAARYERLSDAEKDPAFHQAVSRLTKQSLGIAYAMAAAQDDEPMVAAIGLSALANRAVGPVPEQFTEWAIAALATCPTELEPFLYRVLARRAKRPVIGSVLAKLDEGLELGALADFIRARIAAGEEVSVAGTFHGRVPYKHIPRIEELIGEYGSALGADFKAAFADWAANRPQIVSPNSNGEGALPATDEDLLRSFSRFWKRPFDDPSALLVGGRLEIVERIRQALRDTSKSVLLVGPPGVGKTTLGRAALDGLPDIRLVFEAGAAQTYAGCIYVGELETKIEQIAQAVSGRPTVWAFPHLDDAISAGQHSRSPRGMLDALQSHLAGGRLRILGEVTETGYERLLAERPGVLSVFEVIRVRPLELEETLEVARSSLAQIPVTVAEESLSEAFELTRQFSACSRTRPTTCSSRDGRRSRRATSCAVSLRGRGFRSRCSTATRRSTSRTCADSSSDGFSISARPSTQSSSELPS